MKQTLFILTLLLTSCTNDTLSNITCYGADGKPYFHAISRSVTFNGESIIVFNPNGTYTRITGNCVVDQVREAK